MGDGKHPLKSERKQFEVFFALAIFSLAAVSILYFNGPNLFKRFIGPINPILAFAIVSVLGFAISAFFLSRNMYNVYKPKDFKGIVPFVALAALFGSCAVVLDIAHPFPRDINIAYPKSLLFYPAIGFLVEVVFHQTPLLILSTVGASLFNKVSKERIATVCLAVVALIEPTFQLVVFIFDRPPLWFAIAVWANILCFNATQLVAYKRRDFATMYSLRLVYYLIWHIVWGHARLQILF